MQDKTPNKIFAMGALLGITLAALLGGLALVVYSLRNVKLNLSLKLKSDGRDPKQDLPAVKKKHWWL